ncbi:hypothetical protein J7E62_01630 [Variovorax paradoxus]|nr:hypothetical protein [Variovorax paradoxus]
MRTSANLLEVKHLDREAWSVGIFLITGSSDGFVAGHADLHFDGEHVCRIALAGQHYDQAGAISVLEGKADAFMISWESRSHAGDTGLAEL